MFVFLKADCVVFFFAKATHDESRCVAASVCLSALSTSSRGTREESEEEKERDAERGQIINVMLNIPEVGQYDHHFASSHRVGTDL